MPRQALFAIIATFLFACMPYANSSPNLVGNGGFETGNFADWNTATQTAEGDWFIYSGGLLSLSNLTIPPPPEGAYAAVADQTNPSSMVLYQNLTLPQSQNLRLHYTYYYHNYAGTFVSPDTLDANVANQQARIDIMNPDTVDPYSVDPDDILQTLFLTPPGSPLIVQPTIASFDLSAYAGQTIRLRFAVADTINFFSFGVDNVTIEVFEVLPPLNLTGEVTVLKVKKCVQRAFKLQWEPSPTEGVTKYLIYRNGVLIASVPSSILSYIDGNRKEDEIDQYGVVAFVSEQLKSEPATVIIP